jgi:two-component system, cell cycle sensor histidine kinase and response regulator CckA
MRARILVVEDESIVQLDLENRIQQMGHAVIGSAASGEEAVAKAAELKPDLVLMDVRLEGQMDGVQAASQIRAQREVPVLFLTAHAADLGEHHNAPLLPCVAKPFRTAELQSAITQALDNIAARHLPQKPSETA